MPEMDTTLHTIETFVAEHHILMLATSSADLPQACTLFYAYESRNNLFIVASDDATEHMQNVAENPQVAAAIALETTVVGKIRGLQIKGVMRPADADEATHYFNTFPYAKVMRPKLWVIEPYYMKLTDNRLGFGKKLIWTGSVSA